MILSFCVKAEEMLSVMKQIRRQEGIHKEDVTDLLKKKKNAVRYFLFTDPHLPARLCPGDVTVLQLIGDNPGNK